MAENLHVNEIVRNFAHTIHTQAAARARLETGTPLGRDHFIVKP